MEMRMATTEIKARAVKADAAKAAEKSKDPMAAAFSFPNFELPEIFRSFTEQGLNQTRAFEPELVKVDGE